MNGAVKHSFFKRSLLVCALTAGCFAHALAAETKIVVQAGKLDRVSSPVTVSVPNAKPTSPVCLLIDEQDHAIAGQWTGPSLLAGGAKKGEAKAGEGDHELHFILPELKAGKSVTYRIAADIDSLKAAEVAKPGGTFRWQVTPQDNAELLLGERPVLRYMFKPLDDSTKEAREQTYKVFHHVLDPTGKFLLTKGAGGDFTRHRGLFFGFNKVTYGDGKKADVWHCSGDAHQSHQTFAAQETGPVLGRHDVDVDWHGMMKEVFAHEQRELTVYNVPGGMLIEFAARVRTAAGPIKLDGDPQHAGFQFRAAQEVSAKTKSQTYYIRPTGGVGKPGETQNWDPKSANPNTVDLPWKGMSFVVNDQRFTAANLDKSTNPKPSRFSERDYGRFGSYFEYEITPERPLEVNYRVWIQAGEMTPEQIAALDADFNDPVSVEVK